MLASQAQNFDSDGQDNRTVLGERVRPILPQAEVVPALSTARTAADLRAWLLRFSRNLGFYGGRYVQLGRPCWGLDEDHSTQPIRFLSTSSNAAQEDEDWILADPVLLQVRGAFSPFAWSTRGGPALTDAQQGWLDGERGRGVDAGLAIPVQDNSGCPAYVSLFGFGQASVDRLIEERAPELAFAIAQFHALAKSLVPLAHWVRLAPRLSRREQECLRLAASGLTQDESGRLLGISASTVEFHMRNALEKLGAPNKLRAVVLAFGSGGAVS